MPCVPVALNTGLYWPRRSLVRRPGTATIALLPSIAPGLDRAAFLALLQERVEGASDVLLGASPVVPPRGEPTAEPHRTV